MHTHMTKLDKLATTITSKDDTQLSTHTYNKNRYGVFQHLIIFKNNIYTTKTRFQIKECDYCKRRKHEEKYCRTKAYHQQRNQHGHHVQPSNQQNVHKRPFNNQSEHPSRHSHAMKQNHSHPTMLRSQRPSYVKRNLHANTTSWNKDPRIP